MGNIGQGPQTQHLGRCASTDGVGSIPKLTLVRWQSLAVRLREQRFSEGPLVRARAEPPAACLFL